MPLLSSFTTVWSRSPVSLTCGKHHHCRRALGFNVGRIFGPQLCGWIVDHLGLSAAWVLVAAMLGTAAALLMLVPSPPKADRGRRSGGGGDTRQQKAQEVEGGLQKVGRDLLLGLQLACQDHAFHSRFLAP